MTHVILPAIWLIVFIVGLPQLSETVYTPSLPEIAHALKASESMVEYTLTIYLFAFAIGTFFWGKISDNIGRKPCILAGLSIYIIGCIGCYMGDSITTLMISRFVQAFGGSIGSVLGQAICRDAFHGSELGKVYSTIGSSLAIFQALGPVIGGFIAEHFGWYSIFLFLILVGAILSIFVALYLPETHHSSNRKPVSITNVALQLFADKNVICLGLIVAGCNGISFSYFAEGSFYLIKMLGISPTQYGLSFLVIATGAMLGGFCSKRLHNNHSSKAIMVYGMIVILLSSSIFSIIIICGEMLPNMFLICVTIIAQATIMLGICMTTSNALAMALVDYKWCIGTASSLFGLFYYCLISIFTLGMGYLHNDTLLPMPLYFLAISIFMLLVNKMMKL